jgi:hypothetical protein
MRFSFFDASRFISPATPLLPAACRQRLSSPSISRHHHILH